VSPRPRAKRAPRVRDKAARTRLLIDGVVFQLSRPSIARIWTSLLPALIATPDLDVLILDRGGVPDIAGVKRVPFPTYTLERYHADDSALIQKICDHYKVDVFTSTYYTTPLTTPMFLLVYDMIPELLDLDLDQREWKEKAIAISYARRHIAISNSTNRDLLRLYPGLDHVTVARIAHNRSVFKPKAKRSVQRFRQSAGFDRRPYIITVGEREETRSHENRRQLFEAIAAAKYDHFDILCIGGEPLIDGAIVQSLPSSIRLKCLEPTDDELANAYSGASALVHLSPDEGHGLPVLEAMACGCPVITTSDGPLGEVAGDAALLVDGTSGKGIVAALTILESDEERSRLREAGLDQSQKFDRSVMFGAIVDATRALAGAMDDPGYQQFAIKWSTLRRMQSEVDVDRF
jgi:glycosyltransferase involved in cell wall biosynthesis